MSKEFVTARKVSAIVALTLALVVSLVAIDSYGDPKSEEFIVYDVEASLERAYAEVTEVPFELELEEEKEIINIYNAQDELLKSIEVESNEVIEDKEAKQLINQAEFLSSFGNTSVYKISE